MNLRPKGTIPAEAPAPNRKRPLLCLKRHKSSSSGMVFRPYNGWTAPKRAEAITAQTVEMSTASASSRELTRPDRSKPGTLSTLQREGETGLGLQPADGRPSHRRGRGPESASCLPFSFRAARPIKNQLVFIYRWLIGSGGGKWPSIAIDRPQSSGRVARPRECRSGNLFEPRTRGQLPQAARAIVDPLAVAGGEARGEDRRHDGGRGKMGATGYDRVVSAGAHCWVATRRLCRSPAAASMRT